jgi:hypothetical protein
MDIALVVTFAGILVAGLAGVLGVWMERDQEAPARWAWVFTFLILVSMAVESGHSVVAAAGDAQTSEAMARVLEKLTELADKGDNPALAAFVGAELAVQARSNPGVMKRLEKKVAAKGGDPAALRVKAAESRRKSAGLPERPVRAAGKPGEGPGKAKVAPGGTKAKAGPGADAMPGKAKVGAAADGDGPSKAKVDVGGTKAKAGVDDAKAKADEGKAKVDEGKAKVEETKAKAEETKKKAEETKEKAEETKKKTEDAVKGGLDALKGKK